MDWTDFDSGFSCGLQMCIRDSVYSHPQALMQSAKFLDAHRDWQQISVANTAVAAKKVLEDQDQRKAAICSEYAARLYGLEILEEKINHNDNNSTPVSYTHLDRIRCVWRESCCRGI